MKLSCNHSSFIIPVWHMCIQERFVSNNEVNLHWRQNTVDVTLKWMTAVTLRCLSKKIFWITVMLVWTNQFSRMDNWLVSNDKYILLKEVPPIVGDDDLEASLSLYCCIPVLHPLAYVIKLKVPANEGYHYQLCVCRMIRSLEGNINTGEESQ
jgi:hypothetical protein